MESSKSEERVAGRDHDAAGNGLMDERRKKRMSGGGREGRKGYDGDGAEKESGWGALQAGTQEGCLYA